MNGRIVDLPITMAESSALRALVQSLIAEVRRAPRETQLPLPRWNWSLLDDASRGDAWTDLAAWVSWLVEAYDLDWWRSCWAEHNRVVMWVRALREWHRAVVAPELEVVRGAPPLRPAPPTPREHLDWHTHGLLPTLEVCRERLRLCATAHRGDSGAASVEAARETREDDGCAPRVADSRTAVLGPPLRRPHTAAPWGPG